MAKMQRVSIRVSLIYKNSVSFVSKGKVNFASQPSEMPEDWRKGGQLAVVDEHLVALNLQRRDQTSTAWHFPDKA